MARFNEILVGRFNRGLQKLTGIKGTAPVPVLASEIMAAFPLPIGAEYRYLDSWQLYGVGALVAAGGAGNIGILQLRNPSGSNVVAVVTKIDIISTASQVNVSNGTAIAADLVTVLTPSRFDARGQQNAVCIPSFKNNSVTTFSGNTIWILGANVPITAPPSQVLNYEQQEIPLLPGDGLQVTSITANAALGPVVIWWRERFLEEGERA